MTRIVVAILFSLITVLAFAAKDAPRELDWLELMPKDEVDALSEAPVVEHQGMFKMEQ